MRGAVPWCLLSACKFAGLCLALKKESRNVAGFSGSFSDFYNFQMGPSQEEAFMKREQEKPWHLRVAGLAQSAHFRLCIFCPVCCPSILGYNGNNPDIRKKRPWSCDLHLN